MSAFHPAFSFDSSLLQVYPTSPSIGQLLTSQEHSFGRHLYRFRAERPVMHIIDEHCLPDYILGGQNTTHAKVLRRGVTSIVAGFCVFANP